MILRIKTFICAAMTNQQLIDKGNKMMDETDESIERSKQVAAKEYKMSLLQSLFLF